MRGLTLLFFALLCLGLPASAAETCALHKLCAQMRYCAEADFYFRQCRDTERDADHDGIPCETLCGSDMATYLMRRAVVGESSEDGLGLMSPNLGTADPRAFTCAKRSCKQMRSCAEARYHLTQCGQSNLDRDGDGVPCEALCR